MADAGEPFDIAANRGALIDALDRHRVEYVVIGAVAGESRGADLATKDLDVFAAPHDENYKRLARVLNDVRAVYRVPEGVPEPPFVEWTARMCEQMQSLTLETDHGPFDVLSKPSGIEAYGPVREAATVKLIAGTDRFAVVARGADVIASKGAADRKNHDDVHIRLMRESFARNGEDPERPSADRPDPGRRDPAREHGRSR